MSLLRRREMMAEADKRDVLFKLRNTTDFDGIDDYVDTGIKLFDVADDWTIYFVVDLSQGVTQTRTNIPVFHCIYELSPWPGISFQGGLSKLYAGRYTGGNWSNTEVPVSGKTYYQGCVICKDKFVKYIYDKTSPTTEMRELIINNTTIFNENVKKATLLLGCYQDFNGTKGRFWKGTIYDFVVYNRALTTDEINDLFQ